MWGASCKKSLSHDLLRRHYPHQVKGSKFGYFLSACIYKLPCIYLSFYYTLVFIKYKGLLENIKNVVCRENRFWTFLADKQKAVPEEADLVPPGDCFFCFIVISELENVVNL